MICRIIIIFLLSVSVANAKYYKCFYSKDDVIDYSNSLALFIEENYISVMDNIYHVNAEFVESSSDSEGEFSIYKKEAEDFLYQAKLYKSTSDKHQMKLFLIRKNLMDNKMFPETLYICQNPDTMQDQLDGIPLIIDPSLSKGN
jgi:hypothetical protein